MPAAGLLFAGATAGEAARGPGRIDPALPVVPGEVIVGFAPGVSAEQRDGVLAAAGARGERTLRRTRARLARIDPARLEAVLKRLRADARVAFAEPNYRLTALDTPNDPAFGQLWGLVNTGQVVAGTRGTADADIDADQAWDVTTGSQSVVVGVLDTGVDFSHPDLGGSTTAANPVMWRNPGETGAGRESNGVDDDGNGYVDDWRGWDWVNDDNDPTDDQGHGTHVAGTIGARGDNGIGIAGVNWNVRIMALKFLDAQGSGDLADAVEALRYATAMGAKITNNSWGGGGFSQAMFEALQENDESGRLFVAAAGNSSADNDTVPAYPASYDVPNVVAVAATDQADGLAWFSNRGGMTVGLAAPGTNVYSTVPGGYDWFSGTSMASPHVAGTAALAAAAFPQATGAGLKALLLRTVDAKQSLAGVTATGGRLNAARAVTCSDAPLAWLESPRPGFSVAIGESVSVTVIGTNCAELGGVTVTASVNGDPVALTARGDGIYTGSYVTSVTGPATVTATARVGSLTDSRSVSGTVAGDYRLEEKPFTWLDATAGGTQLTLGDDAAATVPLPFAFSFYNQPYTSVSVSSNGFLLFGSGSATAYDNTALPNAGAPNGLVAAYWDDLNPVLAGAVWHRTIGSAPNRKFVVAWVGVRHYAVVGTITFEAVLEEATGDIVLAYQDTDHGNGGYDHGASASVGVESPTGTLGTQFLFNQALLAPYQSTTSLRFTQSPPAPPDTSPPSAPSGLTATAGELRVELDWAANGESDLAGYHVYRRQTDGTWARIATTVDSAFVEAGLSAGTPYSYRVTAFDQAENEGPPSSEASATPTADLTPPAAPGGLTASAGDGQVALDWADNPDPVAGYRVYRDGVPVATVPVSGYTDGGRTNGVTYVYRVTALDQAGNESGPSNQVSATPQAPPPPPPELDYRLVEEPFAWVDASVGGTRLTLGDDSSVAVTLPFPFRFYGQSFASVNVSSNGYLAFGSPATSYHNRPLPTAAPPNGLVAAYWDDLNPAVAGTVWQRTLGSAPSRRFVVSWVGVRHYAVPGPISFQVVLEESTGDVLLAYLDTDHGNGGYNHGASASVGIESPNAGLGIQFLYNQARLGPYQATTALRFTRGAPPPPDTEPPAVPTALTAAAGDAQVALDWADNADPVAGYRVYRDGVAVAAPTASAYTDTGRTNGVTYVYRVTALDQAGNESGPSNEVSATPQGPPPPPPPASDYRIVEEPIAWLDATAGGTRLTLSDDAEATVSLPFAFSFYGQSHTSVKVSSNGFLLFGSDGATSYANTALPNGGPPNGVVAAYWDDLNPSVEGAVWHRALGSAPNRRFVVSWVGVRHYAVAGPISCQVVLEESTGDVVLAYLDTDHGHSGYDHGASASVGVESPDGTRGTQFLHNQARLAPYQGTTALRFTNR